MRSSKWLVLGAFVAIAGCARPVQNIKAFVPPPGWVLWDTGPRTDIYKNENRDTISVSKEPNVPNLMSVAEVEKGLRRSGARIVRVNEIHCGAMRAIRFAAITASKRRAYEGFVGSARGETYAASYFHAAGSKPDSSAIRAIFRLCR